MDYERDSAAPPVQTPRGHLRVGNVQFGSGLLIEPEMTHVSYDSDHRAPRSIHIDPLAQRVGGMVGPEAFRQRLIHHNGLGGVFRIVFVEVPSGAQWNSDGAKIAGADTARLSDKILPRGRRVALDLVPVAPVLSADRALRGDSGRIRADQRADAIQ